LLLLLPLLHAGNVCISMADKYKAALHFYFSLIRNFAAAAAVRRQGVHLHG
jgi:hypothetical protein